ncbi:MAG: response regulator [Rhodospirillales bacterium]|nr:response regulator [Rhodospirillales bacterium]MCB9964932.1 response regulator [Rhodospirillales bacterium]MCB9973726.1 response regulator [Rhodospirillales bacterium]
MSEQKSLKDLEEKIAAADAANQMKSNFLATMSHEMRTPMQTIYGFLELIELEKPAPNIQELVTVAKNSASSLLEILDDILDFAKMDADKMELDIFEVPVRTLVMGTLEALSVKVQSNQIHLSGDVTSDVPFVVLGDPKRLRQILMNLVGNALKFTKKGTITVTVSTNVKVLPPSKGDVTLRFEVSDTGIGMPPEVCEKLFSPFTQADSSTARKFGGTGLGLSICKKLVELMQGEIGVSSQEGQGSTFWFEIPTREVSTNQTTVVLPDLEGVSILSVEDHPQGAKEIKRSLESMGAVVESCRTVTEGRTLIKRRPFDVAVVDQGLPDGLGIDLIRDIMQVRPRTGLVMYTVRDDLGLQHTCQSLGVTYLSKPASRLGLGEAVKGATQNRVALDLSGPRKLLIAEDTESVRDVFRRQLKSLKVEAEFVENGVEALKAYETGAYGILFTDLHMPEIDGYEVTRRIRAQEEASGKKEEDHFPIIVLTADVQMSQRQTYMSHGFDECLLKPVSLGQFKRLLYRWGLIEDDIAPDLPETPKEVQSSAIPSGKAIDLAALMALMGSDEADAKEMLKIFPTMAEKIVQQIQQAWDTKNMPSLRDAAHSLKGAAKSACCMPLGEAAGALQDAADAGQASMQHVGAVWKRFSEVENAIKNLS